MQKNSYDFNVVISDTSSLSNLININKLDLLKSLYKNVAITDEILDEYKKKYIEELPEWIKVKEVKNKQKINELHKEHGFGFGESSAITFALETPNTLIIIDDNAPRKYAMDIGLNVIGSIGVIRQAVDRNIIKSKEEANDLFDELKNTGGWISDNLLKSVKYSVVEVDDKLKEEKNRFVTQQTEILNNIKRRENAVYGKEIILEERDKTFEEAINNKPLHEKIIATVSDAMAKAGANELERKNIWKDFAKDIGSYITNKLLQIREAMSNEKQLNKDKNNKNIDTGNNNSSGGRK